MHAHFTTRPARPGDHSDFVRFLAELGMDNPVPGPERWASEMMPHTFFLEEEGQKVGYAYVETYGELGYVRHVVVDRDARGRGVGSALMKAIAERLLAERCARWELNVKRDNVPAIRLYESIGMSEQYASSVVRIDWNDALRMPTDMDVVARSVDPEEEARIEQAIGLPDGKILRLREQADQVFVQLVSAGDNVVGFARFDPDFPGAFPFRVKSARHAGALLRALHVHRSEVKPWLQLVIEDDAATTRLLRESGARPVFEIVHYAGSIPGARNA